MRALLAVASPAAQRPVLIAATDLEASRSSVVDVISRFGHNPPCSRKNIDLQALSSQRPQVQLYALVDVRCLSALRRRYPEGCLIWETHGRDLRHGDRLEHGQYTCTGNDPLTAEPNEFLNGLGVSAAPCSSWEVFIREPVLAGRSRRLPSVIVRPNNAREGCRGLVLVAVAPPLIFGHGQRRKPDALAVLCTE